MRKLVVGVLILLAGWGLGWVTSRYPGPDQQPPAKPAVSIAPHPDIPEHRDAVDAESDPLQGAGMATLLQRNAYRAALEHYESLEVQADDAAVAHARAQILAHARRLIVERRFDLAQQLLQRFLVAAYRDVEARILLAQVYQGQQDLLAAIDKLYEARGYAWRPGMLQQISGRIHALVGELKISLLRDEDQTGLLALYRHLVELEPDHAPWFMGLATAQLALEDRVSAYHTLQLVAQDPDVGARARTMLAELSVAFADMQGSGTPDAESEIAGIPLMRSGNHFIVGARPAGGRSIQLLIDTGASLTILTPQVLARHGIRYRDTGRTGVFSTANGRVSAPVYQLDSLAVGDWQVGPLEIGVLDLGGRSGVDGLLGMNFLSHFRFFIDQNEASLRLSAN